MRDDTQPQAPPRGGSEGVSAGRLFRPAATPRLQDDGGRLPRDALRQAGSAFAWTVLAVSAVFYLVLLLPARDQMTALLPKVTVLAQAETTGPVEAPMSEIAKLRAEIEELAREVRDLRARDTGLQRRLDELQLALGPTTAALPHDTASITATIGTPPMPAKPPVTVAYLPLPADGFGDALLGVSPIPIASTGPLTRTRFGVEIAMGNTVDSLRTHWKELQAKHGDLFEGLEVRQNTAGEEKPTAGSKHSLVAGPFDNAADAARLCARLKAASLACKETVFAGESL